MLWDIYTNTGKMANGAVYTDAGDVEHIHDQKLDALEYVYGYL